MLNFVYGSGGLLSCFFFWPSLSIQVKSLCITWPIIVCNHKDKKFDVMPRSILHNEAQHCNCRSIIQDLFFYVYEFISSSAAF
jgi:hypothetical protein